MPASSSWREAFKELFPGAKLDEPMSRHTTFRIGGPADAYIEVAKFDELKPLFSFARERALPVFILGWGSNLLVRDGGIRGIVARFRGEFEGIKINPPKVFAGAGVRLPTLVAECAKRGLCGDESLVGVPGTVGGGLVMNAGTRDGEIGPLVQRVRIFDLEMLKASWLKSGDLEFRYRRSNLENRVILGAELRLKRGSKVDILKRIRQLQKKRQETQPIHTYNVGSTFKNPAGFFVAELIEKAGLKGFRVGGAKVSEKHANFFENADNASARDILRLVDAVKAKIREQFGVELELEMKVVGEV